MTQEERINELEVKVKRLEERNSNLTRVLASTVHMLCQVTHMANNTYYDYSNEERQIIAELNRLSYLL